MLGPHFVDEVRARLVARVQPQKHEDGGWTDLHAFTVERPEGTKETTTIPPGRLDATLRELDVVLTEEELSALLEIYPG